MDAAKMKLFVSAYACEPGYGSELGVGWNWALQLASRFEVWLLTRESNRPTIETWLIAHPETPTIHFVYYDLPAWAKFWKKGLRGVRLYYLLWQYCSNRLVKEVMQVNHISVFHHLTYGNALWIVSRWGSRQCLIWGPIGGLETIPSEFSKLYDRKDRIKMLLRRCVVQCNRWNPAFIRRCRKARRILCKTEATYQAIPEQYRSKAVLVTDVAAESKELPYSSPDSSRANQLRLIAVGRLDAWRGFDLLLEAMALWKSTEMLPQLTILGEGADRKRLMRLVKQLGLQKQVLLKGRMNRTSYEQYMKEADVVVNPSLKEAAVTVSFDALAMGKPLVVLDTKGFTRLLSKEAAIIVPMGHRPQVIEQLAFAIQSLTNKEYREAMGKSAYNLAQAFSWEHKGEEIAKIFEEVYGR